MSFNKSRDLIDSSLIAIDPVDQKLIHDNNNNYCDIIESIDSISRDGTDTPIYVIHYKHSNR